MPYIACSAESSEGFCSQVDSTCKASNICKTCGTFGGNCIGIDTFPNATVSEYGGYGLFESDKVYKIKAEIFARGPVAAGVNALPLVDYKGGVVKDRKLLHKLINHVVSIVGWGKEDDTEYWIVRNSWGHYWGEMGYFRIETGHDSLGIEMSVKWATPGGWTEKNTPCFETGTNCSPTTTKAYVDPSNNLDLIKNRLNSPTSPLHMFEVENEL